VSGGRGGESREYLVVHDQGMLRWATWPCHPRRHISSFKKVEEEGREREFMGNGRLVCCPTFYPGRHFHHYPPGFLPLPSRRRWCVVPPLSESHPPRRCDVPIFLLLHLPPASPLPKQGLQAPRANEVHSDNSSDMLPCRTRLGNAPFAPTPREADDDEPEWISKLPTPDHCTQTVGCGFLRISLNYFRMFAMLMDPAIFGVRSRLPFPACNPRDTPSQEPIPCGSRTERVRWRLEGCFGLPKSQEALSYGPASSPGKLQASRHRAIGCDAGDVQGAGFLARYIRDRGLGPGAKVWKKFQGLEGQGGRGERGQKTVVYAEVRAVVVGGVRAGLRKFIMAELPQHLAVLWPFQVELLHSDDEGFSGEADEANHMLC
jgi:hypothetical protein